MTVSFDDDGRAYSYVGDTIEFNCDNVPTNLPYTVYFEARYKDDFSTAIEPITFKPTASTVQIDIPYTVTDNITIPSGKKFVDLIYSIKACNVRNQVEHTLQIAGNPVGTENILRMYRKQNEGLVGGEPIEPDDDDDTDTDTDIDSDADADSDTDVTIDLYAWTDENKNTVYTITNPPSIDENTYTSEGATIENGEITQLIEVTEEEQTYVNGIVSNSTTYTRNPELDTEIGG